MGKISKVSNEDTTLKDEGAQGENIEYLVLVYGPDNETRGDRGCQMRRATKDEVTRET